MIPKINNIVGYWKGNINQSGDLQDFSGNSNHGSLEGSPTQINTPLGSSLSLNGSNQYVDLGTDISFTTSDQFTVSFVFYADYWAASATDVFIGCGVSGNYWEIQRGFNDTDIEFYNIDDTGANQPTYIISKLSQNTWYHIVTVVNSNTVVGYKNGKYEAVLPLTKTPVNDGETTLLGARPYDGSLSFPGIITQVIMWNTYLNPNEVKQVYNEMQKLPALNSLIKTPPTLQNQTASASGELMFYENFDSSKLTPWLLDSSGTFIIEYKNTTGRYYLKCLTGTNVTVSIPTPDWSSGFTVNSTTIAGSPSIALNSNNLTITMSANDAITDIYVNRD